jgi:hypothetical protein
MMRRVEILFGIGTAVVAIGAIIATIFAPIASAGISIDGATPIIRHVYARDLGLIPMLAVIVFIAALAVCVLLGAYYHTRPGSTFARAILWAAALAYIPLFATSLPRGAFSEYPALTVVHTLA